MFRTGIYMAVVAMMYLVHSSDATNCTSTSFKQDVSSTQLAAAQIIADEYASSTKEQIVQKLMDLFKDTVVSIDYTVTNDADTVHIDYKIIFACNETVTTVLPDGKIKETEIKTKVDKTKVEKTVLAGLTDRANQVSCRAEQMKSGATDVTSSFNLGTDSYFEWTIQMSVNTYKSSVSGGSFRSEADFHTAIMNHFRTKMNVLYQKDIENVTFVSRTTGKSANQYILTFRVFFNRPIIDVSQRTSIVTNIQTAYYEVLNKFFASVIKSMKVPKIAQISVPTEVKTHRKKAIIVKSSKSQKPLEFGVKMLLSKVISEGSSSVVKSKKSFISGEKNKKKTSDKSDEKTKMRTKITGDSSEEKTKVKVSDRESGKIKTKADKSGEKVKSKDADKSGEKSKQIGGKSGEKDKKSGDKSGEKVKGKDADKSGEKSKQIGGKSGEKGRKSGDKSGEKSKQIGGKSGEKKKSGDKSGEKVKGKDVDKSGEKSGGRVITTVKEQTQVGNGSISITVKRGNTTKLDGSGEKSKEIGVKSSKKQKKTGDKSGEKKKSGDKSGEKREGKGDRSGEKSKQIGGKSGEKGKALSKKLGGKSKQLGGKSGEKKKSGDKSGEKSSGKIITTVKEQTHVGNGSISITVKQSNKTKIGGSGEKTKETNVNLSKKQKKTGDKPAEKTKQIGGKSGEKKKSSDKSGKKPKKVGEKLGEKDKKPGDKSGKKEKKPSKKVVATTEEKNHTAAGSLSIKLKSTNETKPGVAGEKRQKPDRKVQKKTKDVKGTVNKKVKKPADKPTEKAVNIPAIGAEVPPSNGTAPAISNNGTNPSPPSEKGEDKGLKLGEKSKKPGNKPAKKPKKLGDKSVKKAEKKPRVKSEKGGVKANKRPKKPTGKPADKPVKKQKKPVGKAAVKPGKKQKKPTRKSGQKGKKPQVAVDDIMMKTKSQIKTPGIRTEEQPLFTGKKLTERIESIPKEKTISTNIFKQIQQTDLKPVRKIPRTRKRVVLHRTSRIEDSGSSEFRGSSDKSPCLNGLLSYLLRGYKNHRSTHVKSSKSDCSYESTYVNYIFEYDIQNQVFNSSFQDPDSVVIQNLQANIAEWSAAEFYKRNLMSYVIDDVRLVKILDVSDQFNNRATLRFYASINVDKRIVSEVRRALTTVFERLQNERFNKSNKKIDWGSMVLIPISK